MGSSTPLYFTVATAGHVDHGKTSVLRCLTGIDPDRLKEEKQRQMTTDLGFAHLNLPSVDQNSPDIVVGFIDVPGHGKFLKNMLAGVGGIHMALLVVAADEGPMPQTIRHVKILSLLGIRRAVVVLTKIDVAPESRQIEVAEKVRNLLETYGLECLEIVPVSCTQVKGFDQLRVSLKKSLSHVVPPVPLSGALLPIDRVFSKSGYGVVITGTLVRGSLAVGDSISIEPGGIKGRVRGLETFKLQIERAISGQRLAVNLALKDHDELKRGQVVANTDLPVVTTIIARIDQAGPRSQWIKASDLNDQPVRLYHGTAECFGHLRWCQALPAEQAGRQSMISQIALTDSVVAEPADRFVLRYGDDGITGGAILTNARPRWLTRQKLTAFCDSLVNEDLESAGLYYLEHSAQAAVTEDSFNFFCPPQAATDVANKLVSSGKAVRHGNFVLSAARAVEIKKRIVESVDSIVAKEKPIGGLVSVESSKTLAAHALDRQVFQQLLKELVDEKLLVRQGDKLSRPQDAQIEEAPEQRALADSIMKVLNEVVCLEIDELAKSVNADRKTVTSILQTLGKQNKARIINYDFASSESAVENAHMTLAKIWGAKREISPSDFREALSTSRKYAMALLAHFDDNHITRRLNNSRVLLKAPKGP